MLLKSFFGGNESSRNLFIYFHIMPLYRIYRTIEVAKEQQSLEFVRIATNSDKQKRPTISMVLQPLKEEPDPM